MREFLVDLWRMVFFQPIRYGTLDLGAHSRGVAGIAWGVAILYALTVASILFANPLRSFSSLATSVSAGGVIAVPELLVPAVLCLLGVAFGLLLAGSQDSPWWRRVLYLLVVWGALISVAGIALGLGASRPLGFTGLALAGVILLYCIAMWTGRTSAAWDAMLLVLLASALLLASYRSLTLQNLIGTESGELVTVSLVLTQVASLALPLAYLSGINATAFGVSFISWSGATIGQRAAWWFVGLFAAVVLGWQWQALVAEAMSRSEEMQRLLKEGLGAAVLLAACACVWWLARRGGRDRITSPVDLAGMSVSVAIPVAYGVTFPALIAALLGALAASLGTLFPEQTLTPLSAVLDVVGLSGFTTGTRLLVVGGLLVGAIVLVRRGSSLLGAIAGIDALVLATFFWQPMVLPSWVWTPSSIGNVGLIAATAMALVWTVRRTWDRDRSAFVLVLALLSALVRQADFFALPLGFVIGASTVALLIVGLVWGFLTDGGEAHEDARRFPCDRRLLTLLGGFLFAITVVAWAVIGKDIGISATLSAVSEQALLTLGSALIIVVLMATASPWLSARDEAVATPSDVESHGVER